MLTHSSLVQARNRIEGQIHRTPVLESSLLNRWSGDHRIFFKAECFQKIGAFKARGGLNAVAHLVERGQNPSLIVANSSGNHAQAVAWAASRFNLKSRIYMPAGVSSVKAAATRSYGAEIVFGSNRIEVDQQVERDAREAGVTWIPPFNHLDVMAGQGTSAMEALEDLPNTQAIFAPCGGGGLLSGTVTAARALAPRAEVFGVEPQAANDAAESLRQGKIVRLDQPPTTLADGARTMSVGELTFEHLNTLDGFYEVEEQDIVYWTQWLNHLLKIRIEPTSAMCMDAVWRYLKEQSVKKTVLVILSGGNLDQKSVELIWKHDCLDLDPSHR